MRLRASLEEQIESERARAKAAHLEEVERRTRMRENPRAYHFAFAPPAGGDILSQEHDRVVAYLGFVQQQQRQRVVRSGDDDSALWAAAELAHRADDETLATTWERCPPRAYFSGHKLSARKLASWQRTLLAAQGFSLALNPEELALVQTPRAARGPARLGVSSWESELRSRERKETRAAVVRLEEAERRRRMRDAPRAYHLCFDLDWSDDISFSPGYTTFHHENFQVQQQEDAGAWHDEAWQAAQAAHHHDEETLQGAASKVAPGSVVEDGDDVSSPPRPRLAVAGSPKMYSMCSLAIECVPFVKTVFWSAYMWPTARKCRSHLMQYLSQQCVCCVCVCRCTYM